MNIQYIIVIAILVLAVAYAGNIFWQKARSSKKGACGSDCGCGSTTSQKKVS